MKQTIVDIFNRRVNEFGPRAALSYWLGERWVEVSWKEWWERAECVAGGLLAQGFERGEHVCVLADTRVEWAWIELGIMMAGGVSVPIYPTSTAPTCAAILEEMTARFVFVGDEKQLRKLIDVRDEPEAVEQLICIQPTDLERCWRDIGTPPAWECSSFEQFLAVGRRFSSRHPGEVAAQRRQVAPGDPAMIIYTSGSMGESRGAVHSHAGLVAEIRAWSALGLLSPTDRQLLFLPMAQLFSKILFFGALDAGAQTFFGRGLPHIITDMRACKPTFIGGVPRIFEVIYRRVVLQEKSGLEDRSGAFRIKGGGGLEFEGALFDWVLKRGRSLSRIRQRSQAFTRLQRLESWAYKHLFLEQIQMLFGGEMRFAFCVGAALKVEVAEFFHAAGVQILEGYGICEAGGVSTVNLPQEYRFGSVGKPLPDVDITIAEDGEVLVRGAMLMQHYYQKEEPSDIEMSDSERMGVGLIDAKGEKTWFPTGDLGEFDSDGFLYIQGRKEHRIQRANEKESTSKENAPEEAQLQQIFPELIEEQLAQTSLISHAVVYRGDDTETDAPLCALITLHDAAETWAIQKGIPFADRSQLAALPEVEREVQKIVSQVNEGLPEYERVCSFKILSRQFSLEANELTVSGKLRRDTVLAHHREWRRPETSEESLR